VRQADPRQVVWHLFQEQAEFVIGDSTEIERPQARRVLCKNRVCVNVIGTWKSGSPPVGDNPLEAQEGLRPYSARMKLDQTFPDLKSLLDMTRLMTKKQTIMGKMLAMWVLVYALGLLPRESVWIKGEEVIPEEERLPGSP
jgi:hypothetical protein